MSEELSDDALLRYSRQIMLPAFDVAGQLALKNARVLVVGLGGLGSPVSMYLAAAGVGTLVLTDPDEVDLTNLQRQVVHSQSSVGEAKVRSAAARIATLNPEVKTLCYAKALDETELANEVSQADAVVDCSDNFETRYQLNAACVKAQKPLVSGAAIRMEGQVAVFDGRDPDGPCYQCLYPAGSAENLTCSESGVLGPLVGVIGSMQALEALKLLAGMGASLSGSLLVFDAMTSDWRRLRLRKDSQCPCCAS